MFHYVCACDVFGQEDITGIHARTVVDVAADAFLGVLTTHRDLSGFGIDDRDLKFMRLIADVLFEGHGQYTTDLAADHVFGNELDFLELLQVSLENLGDFRPGRDQGIPGLAAIVA